MACEPNRARLLCMLSLTFGFFIVEVVVSRITSSLAMLSDSFHMLSDVIALVVALVAVRFAEKTQATSKNTFGWIRAEVMGALVNAVFLTALCFTIILEAIERFTEPREIESPLVVIGVGAAGLLVNLLGLCMFHGHAGGGGHGHSHGGHSHGSKKNKRNKMCKSDRPSGSGSSGEETNNLVGNCGSPNGVNTDRPDKHDLLPESALEVQMNGSAAFEEQEHGAESGSQLNMRGVFLHVLGDALGSVIVVINAIIFTFVWQPCQAGEPCINPCTDSHCTDHEHVNHTLVSLLSNGTQSVLSAGPCWVLYLDPTLCVIMVCILLYTTYPLLKESALILLQTVPKQIDMHRLNEKLRDLEGVLAVHELHIWQLAGSRIIATAHIKCHDPTSYMDVAKRIKDFFHNEGIHATTIQPEFVTVNSESRISLCELSCRTQCAPKLCCGTGDKAGAGAEKKAGDKAPSQPSSRLEIISESPEHSSREQAPPDSGVQVVPGSDPEVVIQREVESSL
ncbi:zinc transporter 1a [Lepisosteus oculatus]|uniref:zinc transporter 1a n=1 Tax=Lepisosteus oculatus TaxID=7918 RepID=UPI00073FCDCE|nr:PREDICTED: zinc transporter 1 [Lepisosteus oculatus]XP_015203571.1 PREDICTED: zinc transporter 1 [Lepisosteus oculatus]